MLKPELQLETMSVKNLSKEKLNELQSYIDTLDDKQGSLIHVLHKAQHLFGFLPKEVQLFVARRLDLPAAKVFGVVSFYSYFTQKPVGKHVISVCMGTACFVKGAENIIDVFKDELGIKVGETTEDKMFTLKDIRCIGACGLAPVVMIGEKVFGHVKKEDVIDIISSYKEEE
ncbi:NADH-quinone oxidoreductase subunit NuoE [Helicovermis profundi]|uniref:NADH-quinone oxidoreductase subunit NuoE n=1 Tax=Helicovermis profundi TaxID=3065157 RepID=A0AAU9ECR6_9FIRM|nr:NADH-quinone oxidoreductase subunit NuoE [Clostridia bacterium S502]